MPPHNAPPSADQKTDLARLLADIRSCRLCETDPVIAPLPHRARPVLQASETARIAIVGQAPGTRVHASGRPFTDASGDRLRRWLNLPCEIFYDASRIAILPMGFCFPGLDKNGSDLPPRPECAPRWRPQLIAALPNVELYILVGSYAQAWHLDVPRRTTLTEIVANWRAIYDPTARPRFMPTPHPSWRNTAWLRRNPGFERDVLPVLRHDIDALIR